MNNLCLFLRASAYENLITVSSQMHIHLYLSLPPPPRVKNSSHDRNGKLINARRPPGPVLSAIATNPRASRMPIPSRARSIIIIHSFKPIYFRFAESAYYVPPPPPPPSHPQLKDYNLRCRALENSAPWARKESRRGGRAYNRRPAFYIFCISQRDNVTPNGGRVGGASNTADSTHRQIPDAQPHLGVLLHEHPPEHVGHGDDDDDEDRRRGLGVSRYLRGRLSFSLPR